MSARGLTSQTAGVFVPPVAFREMRTEGDTWRRQYRIQSKVCMGTHEEARSGRAKREAGRYEGAESAMMDTTEYRTHMWRHSNSPRLRSPFKTSLAGNLTDWASRVRILVIYGGMKFVSDWIRHAASRSPMPQLGQPGAVWMARWHFPRKGSETWLKRRDVSIIRTRCESECDGTWERAWVWTRSSSHVERGSRSG